MGVAALLSEGGADAGHIVKCLKPSKDARPSLSSQVHQTDWDIGCLHRRRAVQAGHLPISMLQDSKHLKATCFSSPMPCLSGLVGAAAGVPPPLLYYTSLLMARAEQALAALWCFYTCDQKGTIAHVEQSGLLALFSSLRSFCCIVLDVYVLALQFCNCNWPCAPACWSNGPTGGPKCHQALLDRP